MSERKWTNEQLDAIYTTESYKKEHCNILVNAAAGSGKTAVLVERIIKKIFPEDNTAPIDVNKLLAVTFTNAAAGEMKERIREAIEEQLKKADDENDYTKISNIKRQSLLLQDADITTIDAFCMKAVRENFHLLGIDPSFSIADTTQLTLMREEAMEEVLEEYYDEGDDDFLSLMEVFSQGREDTDSEKTVTGIYDFVQAMPYPEKWLSDKAEMFLLKDGLDKNPWMQTMKKRKAIYSGAAIGEYKRALVAMAEIVLGTQLEPDKIIELYPPCTENELQYAWSKYYEIICMEYEFAKLVAVDSWDEAKAHIEEFTFETWSVAGSVRNKDKEIKDKDVIARIKAMRDAGKSCIQKLYEKLYMTEKEIEEQLRVRMYPVVAILVKLVNSFSYKYNEKKEKKNVLDFSDIEHLALKLFIENPEIADEYRQKYEEILLDEYQDINGLQEEIFNKISRGNNLFMVGDMKQSIYRFRQSDTKIFKSKSDSYNKEKGAENRKIILSNNFRSRKEVLDSVNVVFKRIMSDMVGELVYDDEQSLNYGNTEYKDKNENICGGYKSECYLLQSSAEDGEEEETLEKNEIEAQFIARKIRDLKAAGFLVRDKDNYRQIRNKDITILMSSHKYVADIYLSALNSEGIDCYAVSGGYFDRNEVKLILSLLKIVQNPYQDIPLLGILRSPVGNFSDDELVKIRSAKAGLIFDALKECARVEDEFGKKCLTFIERLNKWREYPTYMSCDKLLWTLYEETGIYAFVGALPDGEDARANLRLLFERAKRYEGSGYKGLFHFIRYIERLKNKEEDMSVAQAMGEDRDVVRIMTIHKSKGLEFPVVFLAGTYKKFNTRASMVQMHKELGFGMRECNTNEGYIMESIANYAVADTNKREDISEEERKLYVAMTRAKEKLIVTGVADSKSQNIESLEKKWDSMLPDKDGVMSPTVAESVGRYMDWIAPVARKLNEYWHFEIVSYSGVDTSEATEENTDSKDVKEIVIDEFIYDNEKIKNIPTKVTVTALKNMDNGFSVEERTTELAKMPEFMEEKKLAGARLGTVIHYIMQKIKFRDNMDIDYIRGFADNLVRDGEIKKEELEGVDLDKIQKFFKSPLGRRMTSSKKVEREATFETTIPLSYFEGFEDMEESIMLQGVVDCFFEEEEELVIIDYKSDFYNDPQEIKQKYEKQLDWYQYALEKITGKRVREKNIYMFHKGDVVSW